MTADISPVTVFKCLGDATRLRMVLLIAREQELCVCELMWALEESQPKISRHLALLRRARLLADRRQGQWVYYRLQPSLPAWISEMLDMTLAANQIWLQPELVRLDGMGCDRPTRTAACC